MPIRPQSHYARGQARRDQLLDAAVEVIAGQGLEGVTHRAVAAQAGMPLSTTSYFFSSIDELIGAAITRVAEHVLVAAGDVGPTSAATGADLTLDEHVDHLVDALIASNETRIRAQFEAYLATARRPELAESVHQIIEGFEKAAEVWLAALGIEDARPAARELVAMLDGFAVQRVAHPRSDDRAVLRAAIKRLMLAHLQPARPRQR